MITRKFNSGQIATPGEALKDLRGEVNEVSSTDDARQ